jgi:hypothetical protein
MSSSSQRRWYQIAVSYVRSPTAIQRELPFSKSKRCTLLAIAGLPPQLGHRLEEAGLRWPGWQRVAHAKTLEAQTARAEIELRRLAAKRAPDASQADANQLLERGPLAPEYRPLRAATRTSRGGQVSRAA